MKKHILIISITILLVSIVFAGGDERFLSGRVSYKGVFPKTDKVIKKSSEFPVESKGEINPFISEYLAKHVDVQPLSDGFIDVTKAPFNIDNTGKEDVTKKLQEIIEEAYLSRLAIYFPEGTYLVSDQLKCYRTWNHRWSFVGEGQKPSGFRFSRIVGHQLIGAQNGKTIFKLKDDSQVFENVLFKFIQYDMDGVMRDRSNYSNTLRNVEIDLGNNPKVSGVEMNGAQYSTIENVKVYGEDFYAGFTGFPGSGGATTNIEVTGGKIGLLETVFRPNPIVIGCKLTNQSECAVKVTNCRGSFVIIGFEILGDNSNGKYVALMSDKKLGKKVSNSANIALKDGIINIKGDSSTAISSLQSAVFIENVYFKSDVILSVEGKKPTMSLSKDKWTLVNKLYEYKENTPSYVDGKYEENTSQYISNISIKTPKVNFIAKHIITDIPSWDGSNYVNVVTDYGATPSYGVSTNYLSTGEADDIPIQQALNDVSNPKHKNYGKTVFIPYGDFRITKPLFVAKGVKLIGCSKTSAVLHQAFDVWEDQSIPVLTTEDVQNSNIILSDFCIMAYPRGVAYNIQSGGIIMRDIQIDVFRELGHFKDAKYAFSRFSNNVSGKVFTLCSDWISHSDNMKKSMTPEEGYSLLGIYNKTSKEPLTFYQASIEHLWSNKAQVIIKDSENIVFNALKHEPGGGASLMRIKNSKNISIYTTSGHYSLQDERFPSIFDITNSTGVKLVGFTRQGKKKELEEGQLIIHDKLKITDDSETFMYYKN